MNPIDALMTKCQQQEAEIRRLKDKLELQPCGHPNACIVQGEQVGPGEFVHYCGWCASLDVARWQTEQAILGSLHVLARGEGRQNRMDCRSRKEPPDHSDLNCQCSLERWERHPPTTWGHMQPRTMGDPCPVCGGTDYYCAAMMDRIISRNDNDFDAVMQALSELYEEYCEAQHKEPGEGQPQYHLHKLLAAYSRWLG